MSCAGDFDSRGAIPNPHRRILSRRRQPLTVRAERNGVNRTAVIEGRHLIAAVEIPDPRQSLPASACYSLPVRTERQRDHAEAMGEPSTSVPSRTDQTRTVLSLLPLASSVESGEKETALTMLSCRRTRISRPLLRSAIRTSPP